MLRKMQFLVILLVALLALSACSRGHKAAEEEPPAAPAAEEQAQAPETPPTATPAAEQAQPAVTLPTPTPDSDAAAPASQEEAAPPTGAPVLAVENMENVSTYRMRMTMTFESPADSGTVAIEGEYVKEPPAQRIRLDAQTGGESQQMEMVFVGDAYYFNVDGVWMQLPSPMFDIEEMVPVESQDAAEMLSYMKEVGVETVNGRETIHYQGDKDAFPEEVMSDVGVEILHWDLWIDTQEDVVIKFATEAIDNSDENGPTHFTATSEYYDLNADIVIEAPEVTTP
jgi:hypothetical protein